MLLSDLLDGQHRLRVRAESFGLQDPTPAEIVWTVDTTAPVVTLTSAPSGTTTVAGSSFTFDVDDPGAVVECRIDAGTWAGCISPFAPVLPDGAHTVAIRATDAAGNVGTAGPVAWTVDATAPAILITSAPSGTVTTRDGEFEFTVDDPAATVECRFDAEPWASPCASPKVFTGFDDGPHSFAVRATDQAGNVGAEGRIFFIDATAPVVTITSGPIGSTVSTGTSLSFVVDDATATVECRLDGAAWIVPCASPAVYAALDDGLHTFEVRATDENGLVGGIVSRTWSVDTTPPTVTITAGPDGVIGTDSATFEFSADEPADLQCRIDTASWAPCSSPKTFTGLPVGDHLFEVRAIDFAGLTSQIVNRAFTVAIVGVPDLVVTISARSTSGLPMATIGLVTISSTGSRCATTDPPRRRTRS